MNAAPFSDLIRQALTRNGFKERSGAQLLDLWRSFVEQCEEGYDWTIYEYDDEIGVRDHLEAVLNDEDVTAMPEASDFAEEVRRIDERFRPLLQAGIARPDASPKWWRTGVLRFAGDEYRSDMANRYSIRVEPTEGS